MELNRLSKNGHLKSWKSRSILLLPLKNKYLYNVLRVMSEQTIFSISYNIQQPPVSRSFVLQQKIPNNAVCHNLLKTLSNDSNDGKCKVMYMYIWGKTLLHDYIVLHLILRIPQELLMDAGTVRPLCPHLYLRISTEVGGMKRDWNTSNLFLSFC